MTSVVKSRPFGSSSICSARMLVCRALCLTSTSGDSAVTCTDSVTPASDSAKSTFLTWPEADVDVALLLAALKPCSVAVIS